MTSPVRELDPEGDTFPKLVRVNAERIPRKVAIREKDYGIWQSYTWAEYLEQARLIALGLASLGFDRGEKTAVIGDNRPQLYWAMLAPQAFGGVPGPLYQDSIEKEMQYILDHAEARFAIVEDQEQVDKLLNLKAQCPRLEYIIYDDPPGPSSGSRSGGKSPRRTTPPPSRIRSPRGAPTTSPSSATPPAPPAARRASCSPTGT